MSDVSFVSLEHICKSFGGVPVLKDVDFDLKEGEIHALVGGNGAGKSTLMKILNGVYRKDSGVVRIRGEVSDDPGCVETRHTDDFSGAEPFADAERHGQHLPDTGGKEGHPAR